MLVLSRHKDESIHIGDDIVLTVVDVRGDRVRIGIQAPNNISVHRKEIHDLIKKEQAEKEEESVNTEGLPSLESYISPVVSASTLSIDTTG